MNRELPQSTPHIHFTSLARAYGSTTSPDNDAPTGGIKVVAKSGWYAARPSDTGDIYKIFAESFQGTVHLQCILVQAQDTVDAALASPA